MKALTANCCLASGKGTSLFFDETARKCIARAGLEAFRLDADVVGSEHLLLGILCQENCAACAYAEQQLLTAHRVRERLLPIGFTGAKVEHLGPDLPFSPRAQLVLQLARELAYGSNYQEITPEFLMLGLLSPHYRIPAQLLLHRLGVCVGSLRNSILDSQAKSFAARRLGRG